MFSIKLNKTSTFFVLFLTCALIAKLALCQQDNDEDFDDAGFDDNGYNQPNRDTESSNSNPSGYSPVSEEDLDDDDDVDETHMSPQVASDDEQSESPQQSEHYEQSQQPQQPIQMHNQQQQPQQFAPIQPQQLYVPVAVQPVAQIQQQQQQQQQVQPQPQPQQQQYQNSYLNYQRAQAQPEPTTVHRDQEQEEVYYANVAPQRFYSQPNSVVLANVDPEPANNQYRPYERQRWRRSVENQEPERDIEDAASNKHLIRHKRHSKKYIGPVYTYVKTDKHARYKWGVKHKVGKHYG